MKNRIELFQGDDHSNISVLKVTEYKDSMVKEIAGDYVHDKLVQDLELLDVAGDPFDYDMVRSGELTPVFFGSAINNFGVQSFSKIFWRWHLTGSAAQHEGPVIPTDENFSGYIFKIQANMNPAHRDRIAFLRFLRKV